jgi:hypothetical protein
VGQTFLSAFSAAFGRQECLPHMKLNHYQPLLPCYGLAVAYK